MKIQKQILGAQVLMTLLFLFFSVYKTEATAITYTWTGATSTVWNLGSNWSASSGTDYPGNSDNAGDDIVIIANAANPPILSATPTYAIASLTINSGASLNIATGYTLTVTGVTYLNGDINPFGSSYQGKLTDAGAGHIYGNGTIHVTLSSGTSDDISAQYSVKTIILDTESSTYPYPAWSLIVSFDGTSAQKIGNYTYYGIGSLVINNTSGVTQTHDLLVAEISGTGKLIPGAYNITTGSISIDSLATGTGSSTVTFNNEIIGAITGTYTFNNVALASGTAPVTVTGNITVNGNLTGSGTNTTLIGGSSTITVYGTFSVPKFTANTSTVILDGSTNLIAYTFYNLTVNGTATLTVSPLTLSGNLAGTGTLTPGAYNIVAAGNITIANLTTGTGTISHVRLNGATQSINGGYTFNNLVLNSTTGATFNGSLTITGNLTSTGQGILLGSSSTITIGGNFAVRTFTANSSTVILSATSSLGADTFNNLTINGTTTLTGNLIVNGNLAGSGTLTPGSYNVTVGGNTTVAVITTGTGTTTISGTSPTINAQTFYNLTISNTTATLSGNITVNHTLTLSSGILSLGSYKLTISPSGSISGFSSTNYIQITGSGTLEMTVTTAGATFYIGDDYNPITIIPTSGTATYDIGVSDGITDASNLPMTSHAVGATWTITVLSGSQTVTVVPQWDASQELSGFDRTHSFVSTRTSLTSAWAPTAGSSIASGSNPYTQTSGAFTIASGNTYYIGIGDDASALPVTFVSFAANYERNHVGLSWQTASEINNDYFGVERSNDAANWQTIGQVSGHGNSQVLESYNYTDNLQGIVPSGAIYYRLKQVDFNGKFEYSEIRAVNVETNSVSLQTYPNPARNVLNLNWTNADNGNVILKLINTTGTTVYTQNVSGQGLKTNQIDLSSFASGTYFLQIVSDKDLISKVVYKE